MVILETCDNMTAALHFLLGMSNHITKCTIIFSAWKDREPCTLNLQVCRNIAEYNKQIIGLTLPWYDWQD